MPLRQQINQSTSTSTSKSRHIHFAVITVAATTLVFFKSYAAESQTAKLAELYSDFKKVKIEMLEAQYTKKNFKSQFSKSYTLLKQKYEELQKTENLIKKDLLSPEGNQMAFDLEVLAPLKSLADSSLDKKTCESASDENERNSAPDVVDSVNQVQKIIDQVCKTSKK
jgi:hypothetical protein